MLIKYMFLLCLLCFGTAKATIKCRIDDAQKKKIAKIRVRDVKGYTGKCLTVDVENLTNDSLILSIPPGWVFDSDDSTQQNLLVIHEVKFSLKAKEKNSGTIAANCCQSHKRCPSGGKFSKSWKGNKKLQELTAYLNGKKFNPHTVCSAVWAVSDNHSIANICGSGEEMDIALRRKVAEITGQTIPWYKIESEYKEGKNGEMIFVQKKIYGDFTCFIPKGTEFTVKLTDTKGHEIMTISPLHKTSEDQTNYYINFDTFHLPKKSFFLTFYDAYGVVMLQKTINLNN